MQGVNSADYAGNIPVAFPFAKSLFLLQQMKSLTMNVVGHRCCDIILSDISHKIFVLHATNRMRICCYIPC